MVEEEADLRALQECRQSVVVVDDEDTCLGDDLHALQECGQPVVVADDDTFLEDDVVHGQHKYDLQGKVRERVVAGRPREDESAELHDELRWMYAGVHTHTAADRST